MDCGKSTTDVAFLTRLFLLCAYVCKGMVTRSLSRLVECQVWDLPKPNLLVLAELGPSQRQNWNRDFQLARKSRHMLMFNDVHVYKWKSHDVFKAYSRDIYMTMTIHNYIHIQIDIYIYIHITVSYIYIYIYSIIPEPNYTVYSYISMKSFFHFIIILLAHQLVGHWKKRFIAPHLIQPTRGCHNDVTAALQPLGRKRWKS